MSRCFLLVSGLYTWRWPWDQLLTHVKCHFMWLLHVPLQVIISMWSFHGNFMCHFIWSLHVSSNHFMWLFMRLFHVIIPCDHFMCHFCWSFHVQFNVPDNVIISYIISCAISCAIFCDNCMHYFINHFMWSCHEIIPRAISRNHSMWSFHVPDHVIISYIISCDHSMCYFLCHVMW